MAGMQAGLWDIKELKKLNSEHKQYSYNFNPEQINELYGNWKKAVKRSMQWY